VSSLKSQVGSSEFKVQVQSSEFASVDELENVLKEFSRRDRTDFRRCTRQKKLRSKKLYELARKGIEIERKPVQVTIYELEIIQPQETQRNS
ncbi:MAG: hypothetical protein WKF71_12180, partial [Pyrinomonadaceae bacterium]